MPTPVDLAGAASSVTPGALTGKSPFAANEEQFLQMLVAQISHQDPMDPVDDKELVSQLAQFSSVEQAIETNRRLAALQGMTATQDRTAMSALIGKTVTADGGRVDATGQGGGDVTFVLPATTTDTTVRVLDGAGRLVKELQVGGRPPGQHAVAWDGRMDDGRFAPAGQYRVQVSAHDANHNDVDAELSTRGVVTGVAFDDRGAVIMVGTRRIRPTDVKQIDSGNQEHPAP